MPRPGNPNLQLLESAVGSLGELVNEFVFLGGCATGLLIVDTAASPTRETIDVDVIVQVLSRGEYYLLCGRLRQQGFNEDTSEGAPICRWTNGQVILDVIPADPSVLGFGSAWYAPAMKHAVKMDLPDGKSIRIVSSPYFLITKLEAFDGRGAGDYQMSHDIEDIVAVLDGRPVIVDEVRYSMAELRHALAERFRVLLNEHRFVDAVSGHLPTDAASQARAPIVFERMREISELE